MSKQISTDFIREISARTDLVKLIGMRIEFRKHSGKNHFACCPFHDEKTPSFSVNEAEQFYHCFGCGASGDAIRFLMDYEHLSFAEAVESLAAFNAVDVVYEERGRERQHSHNQDKLRHEQGLACLAEAATFFQQALYDNEGRSARAYLNSRHLRKSTVDYFMMGYAPHGSRLLEMLGGRYDYALLQAVGLLGYKDGQYFDWFRDRVMFPIRNVRGQIVGFGARAIGDVQPKYLNSGESEWFNKRYECYGLYEALHNHKHYSSLLVTEGYMDVIKLAQHGICNAVATLGTAVGDTHITQLKKRTKKVYFAFDGDGAGQKAASKALESVFRLHDEQHQWRFVFIPNGEDPDSLIERDGITAMQTLLDSSLSASAFLLRLLEQKLAGRTSVEAGAEVAAYAREWLALLPEGDYRALLRDAIRKQFALQIDLVDNNLSSTNQNGHKHSTNNVLPYRVISAAPHSLDIRLTAMLAQYNDFAWQVLPTSYPINLLDILPIFCQTCYLLHSGANSEELHDWFVRQGVIQAIGEAQRAIEDIASKSLLIELHESLQLRVQQLQEQQKRLEKLGC